MQLESAHLVNLDDLKMRGIAGCQEYLGKVCKVPFPKDSDAWKMIDRYRLVRNVLVHRRGRMLRAHGRKQSDPAVRKFVEESKPLASIQGNRLIVTTGLCLQALDTIDDFMRQLVTVIPAKKSMLDWG